MVGGRQPAGCGPRNQALTRRSVRATLGPQMIRYVIHAPDLGVYLAPSEGRGGPTTLWTHPADSDEIAATFSSPEQAAAEVAAWPGSPPEGWRVVEVEADGAGRATMAACLVAGLPAGPDDGEWIAWRGDESAAERGARALVGGKS